MRDHTLPRKQVHWNGQTKTKDSSRVSMVQAHPRRPIRVFIADRHEVMRIGIRVILEEERDLKIVGETDNVDELLSGVQQAKPHVIVLESWLSEKWNADGRRTLCTVLPSVRILMLMREMETQSFRHGDEGGVQGYLSDSSCRRELSRAIRTVAKGETYLGPESSVDTGRGLTPQPDVWSVSFGLEVLSPQERRIIAFIAEGYTNKEVASKLALSVKTVKNYVANMFTKLALERRTQAVALYMRAQQQQMLRGKGVSR